MLLLLHNTIKYDSANPANWHIFSVGHTGSGCWSMQMANTVAVTATSLEKDVEILRSEAAALQTQLAETLTRFDDVQTQTQSLESQVVDEVCRPDLDWLETSLITVTAVGAQPLQLAL